MKIWLETAIFHNRAPFDTLRVDFSENEIAVLSAVNGRGKTTLISHIVDAFHEMAKRHFPQEFEGREHKFYRLSSPVHNLNQNEPSVVYLRFRSRLPAPEGTPEAIPDEKVIDYIDIRGSLTEEHYNNLVDLNEKIPFNRFKQELEENNCSKSVSATFDRKIGVSIFQENLLTYFPSYRFETPGYLNDPYKIELTFRKENPFSGNLTNPIEVVSGLPQLANWLMDIVLDGQYKESGVSALKGNMDTIISKALATKFPDLLRFGIGPRGFGLQRIQIIKFKDDTTVYPSIFNLSSGESSMLCLFGEILRQADNNHNNCRLNQITGIVVIDEIDKHLHIKLQKESLPHLLKLFPNVQFLVSSHSPFLSMGLAEELPKRSKIIDLDSLGVSVDPTSNALYSEVYDMMINENQRFKDQYTALASKIADGSTPLIVTEGKTDVQHLKKAKQAIGLGDLQLDFFEITGDWGDSKLKLMLEQLSKVRQARKVIGIFDRDVLAIVKEIEENGKNFKEYGNNVYAFCLPTPPGREANLNISIEFLYRDVDLLKEMAGKRIHFDNEVEYRQSASNGRDKTLLRLAESKANEEATKKIFDQDIGGSDWIHSKARFANLVESDPAFASAFDFSGFKLVFDRIQEIEAN